MTAIVTTGLTIQWTILGQVNKWNVAFTTCLFNTSYDVIFFAPNYNMLTAFDMLEIFSN
jgi:hypothetical protein